MLASFTEKIDLKWLQYLLLSVLLLLAVRILSISVTQISSFSPILYFVGIIFLAYASLAQQSIYVTEAMPLHEQEEIVLTKAFHERLTPEQVYELKAWVIRKTQEEKLYLDPGLTLSVLSRHIGISSHELSYVLNQGIGKSFYQFINELRTEEAKSLLLSEENNHLDMLGIAIRAGFNSKTTFYTTFKKLTNQTPKQYLHQHKTPPQP
ncbi:helix-turn-helix domain-containing protein [Sphingobacterium bambusae]|uniref:Helix-turn-helix domain-containing protein n=1 Tax=Sphingobacterium bambusae TaxID=662858 RepID=A0ABW6BCB7_9SPHI|nr:helix-turn-helix domain-containing protein [Sphingobacterium bambusae]WPL49160.1 helix-turn-helix domain-containing protein [Sphingobacterium bambusae]